MTILIFYSPQVSYVVMSPNDAVVTNEIFSTLIQHSNMDTRKSCVRFTSPSGLYSECIDFAIDNNMWFLGTPRCNMKTISSHMAETVNTLTSDLQCKLWNHRLGHPGKEAPRLSSAACDVIPKIHRYPLFKYS